MGGRVQKGHSISHIKPGRHCLRPRSRPDSCPQGWWKGNFPNSESILPSVCDPCCNSVFGLSPSPSGGPQGVEAAGLGWPPLKDLPRLGWHLLLLPEAGVSFHPKAHPRCQLSTSHSHCRFQSHYGAGSRKKRGPGRSSF